MIYCKFVNDKITIAVQSYKNPEMLRLCLKSVQKFAGKEVLEVLVADGETQEDTALMMREEFPDVIFLPHEKNVGFGSLVNACIEKARGEYVFFINSDVILEENSIKTLKEYMNKHPEVGLCGPAQKNFNGVLENTRFSFYKPQTILYRRTILKHLPFARKHLDEFEMKKHENIKEPYSVAWVIGSAMFIRRDVIDKIGGMDSKRFFMYMEDVDWCRRIWEAGFSVKYNPQCSIFHFYGKGSAKGGLFGIFFNKLTLIHISSALKYFLKYKGKSLPKIK